MRLIDADAIKLEKGFFESIDTVPKFFEWLGKQPTIDAVEVVHCQNCGNSTDMRNCGFDGDMRFCHKLKIVTSPEWFCAEGRRNDEGGTD